MENRFNRTYTVTYAGVNPDLTLRFDHLVGMFQESAIAHSDSTDLPMTWYTENQKGFILSNWDIRVFKYPRLYDEVKVFTWPVRFRGLVAQRSYIAFDGAGGEIAKANTRWAFSDLANRKMIKVPDDVASSYGECYEPICEPDFTFPETDGYKAVSAEPMRVFRSDTDTNYHVNNVAYIEWAMDCVPDDIFKNLAVSEMKTRYSKELKQGDAFTLETYKNGCELITLIKSGEGASVLHAGVYTKWRALNERQF